MKNMKRVIFFCLLLAIFLSFYTIHAKVQIDGGVKIEGGLKIEDSICEGGVTLAWDANTEPDLAGYKIYYDIDSGPPYSPSAEYYASEGASPVTVTLINLGDPNNPTYSLTNLMVGEKYYFVVTAYDTEDLNSDYSDEVYCLIV